MQKLGLFFFKLIKFSFVLKGKMFEVKIVEKVLAFVAIFWDDSIYEIRPIFIWMRLHNGLWKEVSYAFHHITTIPFWFLIFGVAFKHFFVVLSNFWAQNNYTK